MTPLQRLLFFSGRRWTPLRLGSALALWLDASDSSTLFQDSALTTPAAADADPVGGWKDKSGLGNHATQATAASRPALKLAIQNGRPVVRCDGVDDKLATTAGANGQPATVVGVMRNSVADDAAEHWILSDGNAKNSLLLDWLTSNVYQIDSGSINGPAGDTAWHVFMGVFNGASSSLRFDGATTNGTTTAGAVSAVICVGSRANSARFWTGDLAELLWVNRALAGTEMDKLASYLKRKWGTP